MQTLIVLILALPAPPHTLVYYYSVLTELCRISPTTVAPSLGKSVRKLYAALGTSGIESAGAPVLDAEGVRRFADWFAVHLSNYGFMWGWNDWCVSRLLPSPAIIGADSLINSQGGRHGRVGEAPEARVCQAGHGSRDSSELLRPDQEHGAGLYAGCRRVPRRGAWT